ncbi:phosphoenolpyruvate--protein phosphotransferase [Mariprofundus ferrinatatus]|uniref:Phosphoenolpyruvate-protein phosphotransferase n=1 Tax=Mariprofundus ferrinatatus TaxID=1921087 RepID=A0A2K8L149_9PROT|nr:phosphoenolpyruvate--protein phosphotransferase [Mariprofundus ferrinatatus]ATX81007.1 phosphoenolpyruvate--protein phosphotransferase [Mariprofundus ferrinatatus]
MSSEALPSPAPRREGRAVASSSGIVIGRVQKLLYGRKPIPEREIEAAQTRVEVQRLLRAIDEARSEVDIERAHLLKTGTHDMLLLLDVHRMLIADPELLNRATHRITEKCINAEWALRQEMDAIQLTFEKIDDDYLRNRKDDIEHAGRRILRHLLGSQPEMNEGLNQARNTTYPVIYAGDDFSVSDIVSMWRHGVAGVVIEQGGVDAHNIIVARGIGLPALVGAVGCLANVEDGETIILDAEQGRWILNPEYGEEEAYARSITDFCLAQAELNAYACLPSTSSDGHELKLMANIEFAEELDVADHIGIDGIGLYRSEFLFLNNSGMPGEDEQFEQYVEIVRRMKGKPVTMRLLDIGGDKPWRYHDLTTNIEGGANPAMGLRGIRLLLRWPDLLRSQLRAMLRAGEEGPVHILIPMVTNIGEIKEVRRLAEECHRELALRAPISIGTMIEVPASALIADELATVSDFFSVGTNDLTQYTLAADRTDEEVAGLYESGHAAVFHLIRLAAEAARRAGIPISICGELSSNPEWTGTLLNLGMDSLSMSLNKVLRIRQELRQQKYEPVI